MATQPSIHQGGEKLEHQIGALRLLIDERDRLYAIMFQHQEHMVKLALEAQREHTNQAFAASEKTAADTKAAQAEHNQSRNNLQSKLDEQSRAFGVSLERLLSKPDYEKDLANHRLEHDAIHKELRGIMETQSTSGGVFSGAKIVSLIIVGILSAILTVLGIIGTVLVLHSQMGPVVK